ncbi:microcephalin [Onthophagus taurus]|uniref:microcephalin n=1 Tax=Onthophagus taurus TaxID=166361 RepID=UPI0039BDEA51
MASNNTSRHSLFSTPQANRKSSSCMRRSLSQINMKEPKETLFSTLMNDPLKKALLMQLLANHKNDEKEIMELQKKKDKNKLTKTNNFSPMSAYRKKVFAAEISSPTQKVYIRAPLPFNKLLCGVVAYVEIISRGQDRSSGVKALLKTMGGRVSEFICKGITHAIIKDVSYETYKRANLVKAQLVSVLWLEAVRKNHCRVPEKHYPALGPQAYSSNVSLLCEELQQEYAEVVEDELECSRNLQKKMEEGLSAHFGENVVNSSISGDSFISSGIGTIFQHSKGENKENSQHISLSEDENVDTSEHSLNMPSKSNKKSIASSDSIELNKAKQRTTSKGSKKSMTRSESVESLRISSESSKQRTTASSALSSLRISTESNKSKQEPNIASEPIESLQLSSNSSNRRSTRSSALSSLKISLDNGFNKKISGGVSEPIGSLRISSASSKRRTPELSAALSSLRVSLSDDSKEISSDFESSRSSNRLKKKMTSFETNKSNTENDSIENGNLSPEIPIQKNIYVHITERKKSRARLNFSSSDENDEKEAIKSSTNNVSVVKRKQLNFSSSDDSINDDKLRSNLEISSILMTPSAKKILDALQNSPSKNDNNNQQNSSISKNSSAKRNLHNNSSENDSDKSQRDDKSKKTRKRKLYNENDVIAQILDNDKKTVTTPKSKKFPENVISKTNTTDDNLFKTPGKPVKEKKVNEKKLTQHNSSQGVRSSQRIRRSTLDFLPKESFRTPRKYNTPVKPKKITSIVCSRFHTKESIKFEEIVKKLGNFITERDVTEDTSHLILAEPKRTINVLRAMARGCWILRSEWLYKSLKEQKWLPEENYEMTEFSMAVQKSRQEKQAFGRNYTMDLFSDCGKIYIAKTSTPQCGDLQKLVKLCKGKITTIRKNADIIVGEYVEGTIKCVKENWILDCIQFYKTQSFKSYLLFSPP